MEQHTLRERKEQQLPEVSSKKVPDVLVHRYRNWSGPLWQWVRFCLAGGANTLVDMLVLNMLLLRFPTTQVQILVIYNSLAYLMGAASSFFLNKYWTFGRRQRPTRGEVGRFLAGMFMQILSSNGLLWLISHALQPLFASTVLWVNTSKLLVVVTNAVLSYLLMHFWIFKSQ
jgi:putative flippase GtrA